MKPAIHSVLDTVSGISIEEREESQGRIAIVINGLPVEPAQCIVLQRLLGLWKYGLTPKKKQHRQKK